MIYSFRSLLQPLLRRVRALATRAVVTAVDDAALLQLMQVKLSAYEVQDGVPRLQEYGLASFPHNDCEALVIAPDGERNQAVIVACGDRRYRLTGLVQGEVALYDDLGSRVHLKREGQIEVMSDAQVLIRTPCEEEGAEVLMQKDGNITVKGTAKVFIDAPEAEFSGNVTVAGNVAVSGDVTAGEISLMEHTHEYSYNVSSGGSGSPVVETATTDVSQPPQ